MSQLPAQHLGAQHLDPQSERAQRLRLLAVRAVAVLLLATGLLSLLLAPASAQDKAAQGQEDPDELESSDGPGPDDVLIIPVRGQLTGRSLKRIRRQLEDAVLKEGYVNIILKIDTPGGELYESQATAATIYDLSRRHVKGRRVMTIAYVPSGGYAYSAGTLLALACSEIEMGENSRLGNVEPVDGFGNSLGEKFQTVVRNDLIKYGGDHGYPEALMAAMVTKEREVYQVFERTDSGSVVTKYVYGQDLDRNSPRYVKEPKRVVMESEILTIHEKDALEYGLIDRVFASTEQLLDHYQLYGAAVNLDDVGGGRFSSVTWTPLQRFLASEITQFMLILLGVLGLVVEMKMPGFGVPGILGTLFFVVFFVGAFWNETASWLDVSLFVLSLVLLAIEVFVIPGFGVAGVLGLIGLVASLILALYAPGSEDAWTEFRDKTLVVMLGLGSSVIATFVVLHYLPGKSTAGSSGWISRTVLDGNAPGGNTENQASPLLSKRAVVVSDLRPAGKVELDGELLDVVAAGEFIQAGATVEVSEVEGNRIVVRPVTDRGQSLV